MPTIDAEELCTRHSEFLSEIRRAIRHGEHLDKARERIVSAQESYKEWFAERGITLTANNP